MCLKVDQNLDVLLWQELMRKGLMHRANIGNLYQMMKMYEGPEEAGDSESIGSDKNSLMEMSVKCQGFSGRTIRKAPFLTLTHFHDYPVSLDNFFFAMEACIRELRRDMKNLDDPAATTKLQNGTK